MVEYGQVVGQSSQVTGGGIRAVDGGGFGASVVDSATAALNHTAATLGVSPSILIVALLVGVVFLLYLAFAR